MRSQHSEDVAYLRSVDACPDAVQWLEETGWTLRQAWRRCPRGDWMLWLAAVRRVDRRVLTRVACECARLALPLVSEGEDRPRRAIEMTERWCDGHATIDEVRQAANDANDAVYAAYAARTTATTAAYAAAAAAHATCTARDAATTAIYAAYANRHRRRHEVLRECATIVRRHIPTLPEADDE